MSELERRKLERLSDFREKERAQWLFSRCPSP